MRGPTMWSVGERELFAATVAKWRSGPFCVGAHGADAAAKTMERLLVDTVLLDCHSASISVRLKSALAFLDVMKQGPGALSSGHVSATLRAGVAAEGLAYAIAVGTLFNTTARYANALEFAVASGTEFDRAEGMLLKRGYAWGSSDPDEADPGPPRG